MNAIIDRDGNFLAEATLRVSGDGRILLAESVQRGGRLVRYYFQEGGRHVTVSLGDRDYDGRLATRWVNSRRAWVIRLEVGVDMASSEILDEALSEA